jgi:TFIIIC subunit triple barrel domain
MGHLTDLESSGRHGYHQIMMGAGSKGKSKDRDSDEGDLDEPEVEPQDDDGAPSEGGDDNEQGRDIEAEQEADQGKDLDSLDSAEDYGEIQILDLHSKTPYFSYRGKVFAGHWAKNLGTEMLFAKHDEEPSLPSLKTLEGGVDILGACWSRMLTTEKKLIPRERQEEVDDVGELEEELARIREQHGIQINVLRDKTGERREQARFLENLQALKRKKGETDEVTVVAISAQSRGAGGDGDPKQPRRRQRRQPKQPRLYTTPFGVPHSQQDRSLWTAQNLGHPPPPTSGPSRHSLQEEMGDDDEMEE